MCWKNERPVLLEINIKKLTTQNRAVQLTRVAPPAFIQYRFPLPFISLEATIKSSPALEACERHFLK